MTWRSGIPNLDPRLGFAVFAVAALAVTGGCANKRGGSVAYDVQNFGSPDAPSPIPVNVSYRIGAGDTLSISVYRVPDLTGDRVVDPAGRVEMPLLGAVQAAGKTTDEFAADVKRQLEASYLQSPQVLVTVKEALSQRVTVDGAVSQPGIYAIGSNSTTLIQAVALARGTSENANPRRVVVFRTINGQRQAAAFDLTDIRRGIAADPVIYGNDVIVIDGSASRQAFRDFVSTIPLIGIFRPF